MFGLDVIEVWYSFGFPKYMTRCFSQEIISEEIVDETDQYEDNQSKRYAKRMINTTVMRECVCIWLFGLDHTSLLLSSIVERERSVFTRTSTIESTQMTSVNIEAVPLLPGLSQDDYPRVYHYVYNSIGESES
jgi:metal transporter CNNM